MWPSISYILGWGILATIAIQPTIAVYLDEAYSVDFHYALLGQPLASNTFFHQPVKNSKASLLYTLSDENILGAVNPKDGSLVWRQQLSANRSLDVHQLRVGTDQETIFTGGGTKVLAWSAADGRLAWQKDFAPRTVESITIHSSLLDPTPQGSSLFISLSGDGSTLVKLDMLSGKTQWTHREQSNDVPFALLTSHDMVYLVSLRSAVLGGWKLKITTFKASDGSRKGEQILATDGDIKQPSDIIFVGSSSSDRFVAWTDAAKKTLKLYVAGANNFQSFEIPDRLAAVETVSVHTAGTSSASTASPHFVVRYQSSAKHWADTFQLDLKKSSVRHTLTVGSVDGKGVFSATVVDGKTYIVRITEDQTILTPADDEVALYKWDTTFRVPGLVDLPTPVHATAEVAIRSSATPAVRVSVLLSTGDWVLVRDGEASWSRPETLAAITLTEWAGLTENQAVFEDLKAESGGNILTSFWNRALRHFIRVQSISHTINTIQAAIINQLFGSGMATNEAFGFNKLLIARTKNGRLVALDVGERGRIVWNIDGAGNNGKCLTLENSQSIASQLSCLNQLHPSAAASSWARLTNYRDPVLNVEGESIRQASFGQDADPSTSQVLYSLEGNRLRGYAAGDRGKSLWSFQPLPGHRILSVQSQMEFEPVASIGKVLADRRVLYKYLNPNAAVVISVDDSQRQAVATLIDTVSGNVLYSSKHEHVDTSRTVTSAISENWMALSYTMDSPTDSVSKGYQLAVAEFYESKIPNDRGVSGSLANFSTLSGPGVTSKPYVYSQSYHIPEEISRMVVTQTGQGITSRQLLVGLKGTNSIVSIPRQAIDPRRTVGKEPSNPEKWEEGLSKYSPMIDFDPTWYLNHQEEIFGLDKILVSPSLLESTSLVFAYGLDVFGTRISPSFAFDILGTEFNKIQLVLTVIGLLAGVFIVAPIITRKQTNLMWQAT